MKVWLVSYDSYGEVDVYSEDTDITKIPGVETELSYLDGAYEDERESFLSDFARAKARGAGSCSIEERLSCELVEVKNG